MPEQYEGLCSACKYSSRCTLTKSPGQGQGIHFCEEYEAGGRSHPGRKAGRCAGSAKLRSAKVKLNATGAILGLCGNCVNRDTCRFPRPESGVWHCEEYQ
ncbi:MAG: hypothetical protein ACOX3E_16290 [Desulfomonilia bacterium]|jgi:hypothetical protein|uniref:Uncharacterized protein n=1 Tax=anaerobic digester metagenome TaxID=1263854 RepID=A0A485LZ53_9ZZZZ|nr:hypothetical protein [Pseudomonadota bacterium]HON37571.1 hypothetical protein [Deltaproteobacteria bacterium]HRS55078.1 hypothetical protein [Desulfomonilia bacterium]HPD21429.1 hypothetical protein [Deltaproteobacteria bacterium]HPX51369.1 hypothetical protein [Deltaproteobacteria bacterium]